jgi:hypothetical protein
MQHHTKAWFKRMAIVTLEHFDDNEQARRVERVAIRNERPRYNKNRFRLFRE